MQINSILDIVDGELLNSPSISFIYNIKSNPKKIIEGDLFIAHSEEDIKIAIDKGAFAILVDFDAMVIDTEIAWIKVDSIENALIKLFRYKLSNVDLKVFYCDQITFELVDLYKSLNKNIKLISSDLSSCTSIIETILEEDILFCSNKELLNKIYPNNINFNQKYTISNLTEHSLFETSFSFKENYFSKLKISSLYANQFLDAFEFFQEELDLNKLKRLNSFKPIFIDKFLSVIEFGRSDKFILVQKNKTLVKNEIAHINRRYNYAKTIYLTKEYMFDLNEEQYVLNKIDDLKELLKTKKFNCVYIIGYDFNEIEFALSQMNHNQTLL